MPDVHHPIRAVLFDLDETLNDRAKSWMAFVALLARPSDGLLNPCVLEEVHRLVVAADRSGYRPKDELFADLCSQLPWRTPPTPTELERYWREHFPSCTAVRESAIELIKSLRSRGIRIGIVTNGQADSQAAKIKTMGLDARVDAVVISGAVGFAKPDRRIFELALQMIGTTAAATLFAGDDPERDICGPTAAGMRTAWLHLGKQWPSEHPRPTHSIASLHEIDSIVGG